MKSPEDRKTETVMENVFLILFTVLALGSFGVVIDPLSGLDSILLERGVEISVLLVLLLGFLGFLEGF